MCFVDTGGENGQIGESPWEVVMMLSRRMRNTNQGSITSIYEEPRCTTEEGPRYLWESLEPESISSLQSQDPGLPKSPGSHEFLESWFAGNSRDNLGSWVSIGKGERDKTELTTAGPSREPWRKTSVFVVNNHFLTTYSWIYRRHKRHSLDGDGWPMCTPVKKGPQSPLPGKDTLVS